MGVPVNSLASPRFSACRIPPIVPATISPCSACLSTRPPHIGQDAGSARLPSGMPPAS